MRELLGSGLKRSRVAIVHLVIPFGFHRVEPGANEVPRRSGLENRIFYVLASGETIVEEKARTRVADYIGPRSQLSRLLSSMKQGRLAR